MRTNKVVFSVQVVDGRPLNIRGRTGLKGRGILGRYGPNHAADPIVTRWARNSETGEIEKNPETGKNILEFVAIKRRDTGEWAIPGGKTKTYITLKYFLLINFTQMIQSILEIFVMRKGIVCHK